jgi:hypothetical protein
MSTLTRRELLGYPGADALERWTAHHSERRSAGGQAPAAKLSRRIDVRRFPGRDRVERVMLYLRASLPQAESWSDEAVREMASRLVREEEIVE